MVSPFFPLLFFLVVYIYAYLGETFKAPSIVLFCVGGKKKKKTRTSSVQLVGVWNVVYRLRVLSQKKEIISKRHAIKSKLVLHFDDNHPVIVLFLFLFFFFSFFVFQNWSVFKQQTEWWIRPLKKGRIIFPLFFKRCLPVFFFLLLWIRSNSYFFFFTTHVSFRSFGAERSR